MDEDLDQPGSQGDSTGPTPAGQATPPGDGAPAGAPAPAADLAAGGTPGQAPRGYVPQYRLNQVTERYNRLETAYRQLAEQVQRAQAAPPNGTRTPANPEEQVIRDQFYTLFPHAKALLEDPRLVEQLSQLVSAAPQMQAQQDHYWQVHGTTFLTDLRGEARKLWGEDANPAVLRTVELAFLDHIESDPEAQRRYLQGDRTLVADFWKVISAHLVDPIRRRAAADVQRQGDRVRRVPSPGPGTGALGRGAPPKPKSEEELHDAAWNALQNAR